MRKCVEWNGVDLESKGRALDSRLLMEGVPLIILQKTYQMGMRYHKSKSLFLHEYGTKYLRSQI